MTKELYISEVKNLLIEFYNQLEFQKKVFVSITESLHQTEKLPYIKKIQKEQINDLFDNNEVIVESYKEIFPKRILSESKFDIRDEINKFNDFLFLSMCQKIGVLREDSNFNPLKWVKKKYKLLQEQRISDLPQNQQTYTGPKPNFTQAKPGQQTYADYKKTQPLYKKDQSTNIVDDLKNAVDYIKQNGISSIMEGLRSALFSLGGVAVQTILAFTGAGLIVNDVAWGILTLYDAYQYFENGSASSLFNLIIDIICLVTGGSLSGVLKGFIGKATTGAGNAIKMLMEGAAGKYIKPVIETIKNGASLLSKWLGEASTFMKSEMGIGWVSKHVVNIKNLFNNTVSELSKWTGEAIGSFAGSVSRGSLKIAEFMTKPFDVTIFRELQSVAPQQIEKWVGKTISQSELKAAEKYAEDNLKEKPTEEALKIVDSKFGTHIGDLYALQLNARKLGKSSAKISQGLSSVDIGTEISRGRNPGEMISRRVEPIKQSGSAILGI